MIKPWYTEQPFKRLRDQLSKEDFRKLKRFYTQQLELCLALQAGKPLGTCKTITSGVNPLVDILVEENYISRKDDLKETCL